jgi:hypothetical protein
MDIYQYTVCRYFPDLRRPENHFDFGVAVAAETGLIVAGRDLATSGVGWADEVQRIVVEDSMGFLVRKVKRLRREVAGAPWPEVFGRMLGCSLSCVQCLDPQEVEAEGLEQAALSVAEIALPAHGNGLSLWSAATGVLRAVASATSAIW